MTERTPNWGGDRRSAQAKAKHLDHPGNPLWEFRVSRGLAQRELADMMYIAQQTISDVERGQRPISPYIANWLEEHKDALPVL